MAVLGGSGVGDAIRQAWVEIACTSACCRGHTALVHILERSGREGYVACGGHSTQDVHSGGVSGGWWGPDHKREVDTLARGVLLPIRSWCGYRCVRVRGGALCCNGGGPEHSTQVWVGGVRGCQ